MAHKLLDKILKKYGRNDLIDFLSQDLSGSHLNSLLLEVYRLRSQDIQPAEVLKSYTQNRFVQKVNVPVVSFRKMELRVLEFLENINFEILQFGPTAPFGSCSVLGTISQNLILSAFRGTEVVADVTNLMALESAHREKSHAETTKINLAAVHRLTRCQPLQSEKHAAHFKILCLTTSGHDTGNATFEVAAFSEHINTHLAIFTQVLEVFPDQLKVKIFHLENQNEEKLKSISDRILPLCNTRNIEVLKVAHTEKVYYQDLQFQIYLTFNGEEHFIVDGGMVDWTQKLLQNKKARLMTSGMGTEYLFKVLNN